MLILRLSERVLAPSAGPVPARRHHDAGQPAPPSRLQEDLLFGGLLPVHAGQRHLDEVSTFTRLFPLEVLVWRAVGSGGGAGLRRRSGAQEEERVSRSPGGRWLDPRLLLEE